MIRRQPRYTVTIYYLFGHRTLNIDTIASYELYSLTTASLWYNLFGVSTIVWDRVLEYQYVLLPREAEC